MLRINRLRRFVKSEVFELVEAKKYLEDALAQIEGALESIMDARDRMTRYDGRFFASDTNKQINLVGVVDKEITSGIKKLLRSVTVAIEDLETSIAIDLERSESIEYLDDDNGQSDEEW